MNKGHLKLYMVNFPLSQSTKLFPDQRKERYWIPIGICPPIVVKPLKGHFFHGLMVWPLVLGNSM